MAKPSIPERIAVRICPECQAPVARKSAKGRAPKFCCDAHARAYNNRLLQEGAAAIAFLKGWRVDRGSGPIAKDCLTELCAIADHFNARDLEAGRVRADYYAATILADGTKYIDRRR